MADPIASPPPVPLPIDARASRVLSANTASAIGAIVTVGLTVYLLIGLLFPQMGTSTSSSYLLLAFLAIPIVLALGERASNSGERGGLFQLMLSRNRIQASFFLGWLMVGALVSLGATIAAGAASHLALALAYFTETTISTAWLAVPIVLLIMLNQWPRSQPSWSRRATLLGLSLIVTTVLLLWARLRPPESALGYAYLQTGASIRGAATLACGLWALHFILENRQYMRGRAWHLVAALGGAVAIAAFAGALAGWVLGEFPQLALRSRTPLIELAQSAGLIPAVVTLGSVVTVSLLALDQVLSSGLRAAAEMAEAGFLPTLARPTQPGRTALAPLLVLGLAVTAGAALLPIGYLVTGASFGILVPLAFLLVPTSLRRDPTKQVAGAIRLPVNPLIPVAAVVVCLTLLLALPTTEIFPMVAWLVLGLVYYLLRARKEAIGRRRELEVVARRAPQADVTGYRILVAVANPQTAGSLLRAGQAVARARGGSVTALRILETSPQASNEERQRLARHAWDELQEWIRDAGLTPDAVVQSMVRQAPSVLDGLQATAWEESVDSLLLGWPVRQGPRLIEQDNLVDRIVRSASCEILILRGQVPDDPKRVLIPLTSESHAPAALELGRDLAPPSLIVLKPTREPISASRHAEVQADISEEIDRHGLTSGVETRIVHAPDPLEVIVAAAGECDLTILGVSEEGFLAVTEVTGLPRAVAESAPGPVLLIKRREVAPQFWLRRGWEQLYSSLPTLTRDQQRVVGLGLRQDARAGIDFYVLIILSSSLAFLGLLQNSSAVIIGAMLVAPLMSPILAMAHGIVRGDAREIRQAANSTLNGVILAITLPAFLSLLLLGLGQGLNLEATPEILARTQPALLDLLVAFISGLAAAYAISRAEVAAALPGVAIAAALVPPLAVVGYGLGTAQFLVMSGALLLFLTNLAAIVLAGTTMFLLLGMRPPLRVERGERTREALRWAMLGIVVVSIPLLISTVSGYRRASQQAKVESIVAGWWPPGFAEVVHIGYGSSRQGLQVALTLYQLRGDIGTEDMDTLQAALSDALGGPVILDYVIIPAAAGVSSPRTPTPTATPTPTPTPRPSPTAPPVATPSPAP